VDLVGISRGAAEFLEFKHLLEVENLHFKLIHQTSLQTSRCWTYYRNMVSLS